jgi:hypothetical protein
LTAQPKGQFNQILDLIGATITVDQGAQPTTYKSPFQNFPIEMAIYLPILMDKLTTVDGPIIPGRININEAPIEIEWYWRKHHERFEKHVMRIAERRVKASTESELQRFRSCLEDNLNAAEWEPVFNKAATEVANRVRKQIQATGPFQEWLLACERFEGLPSER